MSWSDTMRFARVFAALALAGLTAGCFQPLYAEHPHCRRQRQHCRSAESGRRFANQRPRGAAGLTALPSMCATN